MTHFEPGTGMAMRHILTGFFLLIWSACCYAGISYIDAPLQGPLYLSKQALIYEDPGGRLDIASIAALPAGAAGFQAANRKNLHPGDSRSAWWMQLNLMNRSMLRQDLRLVLSTPNVAYQDAYIQHGSGWQRHRLGEKTPLSEQGFRDSHLRTLPLQLQPGESLRIFVRSQSSQPISLQPVLYAEADFALAEKRLILLDGVLFGGLLALTCCALLVTVFSRKPRFGVLALACFFILLYEADLRGYTKFYLWPETVEWAHRSTRVLGSLSLAALMGFVLLMIKSEGLLVRGRRYYEFLVAALLALALFSLFGDVHLASQISFYARLIFAASIAVLAYLLLKQSVPGGWLIMAVGLLFVLQVLLRTLQQTGWLPGSIESLGLSHAYDNPVLALAALAINLAILTAWIVLVCKERGDARRALVAWQEQEQERLKQEIARQTAELKEARHYAEEKNRQKTEMLGYIGHDLREPLATIVSYARLLQDVPDTTRQAYAKAIERNASFQLTLIDDLLEYAKGELQPLALAPRPTSLPALLDHIAQYATAFCARRGNWFHCAASPALPETVMLDDKRLLQVLLNLLSNAAKFTSKGMISLELDAHEKDGLWQLDFTVQDSGIGIADAAQTNIFDAFTQLNYGRGGVGLGLYIARNIVENMGGKLALESSADTGSRFSFSITVRAVGAGIVSWDSVAALEQSMTGDDDAWGNDFSIATDKDDGEHRALRATQAGDRPPEEACIELAKFARNGMLSNIEDWLCQVPRQHPQYAAFYQGIEAALQTLDLERIASLARPRD